ncbi:MAG: hypothetical protein WEB88_01045 [Gemmatimonadota bacterium]
MRATLLVLAGLTAGCAGGAAPEAPVPGVPAFSYVVPEPPTLTYERTDSSVLTMELTGMGSMTINVTLRTVAALGFEPGAADGVQVRVDVTELEGTVANAMAGTQRMSQTPGPALLQVSAAGDVEVLEKPTMPAELAQVVGGESLYRDYFLQLPSEDVRQGVGWVDTVTVTEDTDGMRSTSETIIRSVWARDTTWAGQSLRVVESTVDITARVEGSSQGTRIEQQLAGNGTAVTLWDPRRHLVVARQERAEMSGTMALPDMGMSGMPVSMRTRSHMVLRPDA